MARPLLLPLLIIINLVTLSISLTPPFQPTFTVQNDEFVKDGAPLRILSGELHYFRIPRVYWQDRLARTKALGFNAIQTYIPWNYHQPTISTYEFSGEKDFVAYLKMANDMGLMVLLRPGPYICAEWDAGGIPAWLLGLDGLKIRTYEKQYIAAVDKWFQVLLPMVKPLLYQKGGPIVMVQVENEFGSYGDVESSTSDMMYMQHLRELFEALLGPDVLLYTTDFGNPESMRRGSLMGPSVITLGDFGPGSNVSLSREGQTLMNAKGLNPAMCSEYYSGWYTYWGQEGATNTSTTKAQATLAEMLKMGFSVSMYMAHGGTNFGFWSGANVRDGGDPEDFVPLVTSYDYSAPISEAGDHNTGSDGIDKFSALRALLASYSSAPPPPEPPKSPRFGCMSLESKEEGFVELDFALLRDRVHVFVDGEMVGVRTRSRKRRGVPMQVGPSMGTCHTLDLLVEALGRVNYGPFMTDLKGITHNVTLGGVALSGNWSMTPITLQTFPDTFTRFDKGERHKTANTAAATYPSYFRGVLHIDGPVSDTYVSTRGWGHGQVWINRFNVGRYWDSLGPVHTLYVPANFLTSGSNEVIVLEMDAAPFSPTSPSIAFIASPDIDV